MATPTRVPHLVLIARSPALLDAWRRAIARYFPASPSPGAGAEFSVHEGALDDLPPAEIAHECVVSPANAFGIMDGGFDLALSRAFRGPSADLYALTDHVQTHLRARWAGYAPPGTCTLVPLPDAARANRWGTHTLAVVPTMKRPEDVDWNRELVYGATWGLLCELGRWNARVRADGEPVASATSGKAPHERGRIERVLMTGLGTGAGGVSAERCARQMVLAVKHYVEAEGLPERLRWETAEVERRVREVEETVAL
ncbi:hypothetical protein C8T65DRAFT_269505 [Cerioporus squamosus]|nr:hypothetical protein C8T65DRAFT_269505 [Cerioporus squamosus]